MQNKKIHILSTKQVDEPLCHVAGGLTVFIDALSFIRIEAVNDNSIKEAVSHLSRSSTVIFTSRNAAEAVETFLNGHQPEWKIFCVGKATTEMITRTYTNSSIAGTANNASALAEVIVNNQVQSAVFFCGDQRREELPERLRERGISLIEIVVYRTVLTPKKAVRNYNGILFFSPSAVKSFFSQNTIADECTLFAIGGTTADCIRQHSGNRLVISNVSENEALVKKAITYFTKIKLLDGCNEE